MTNRYIPVTTRCPFCTKETVINVNADGWHAWREGAFIQNALPELSVDMREQLISGTCPSCWDSEVGCYDE